jgi:hypothetical protein
LKGILAMVAEMGWREQSWRSVARGESLHCDVCWALIPHDFREAYIQTGLCEFCDARLNPYPRQPDHENPHGPGGIVC